MINNLDELAAFFKLCRKQGISEIKMANISVTFGEIPKKPHKEEPEIVTDGPTDEQLMFYSAGEGVQ